MTKGETTHFVWIPYVSAEAIQSGGSFISVCVVWEGGGEMRRVTELEEETGVHVETREIRQSEMGSGTQMLKKSVKRKILISAQWREARQNYGLCYPTELLPLFGNYTHSWRGARSFVCQRKCSTMSSNDSLQRERPRVLYGLWLYRWSFVCVSAESIQPC